MTVQQIATASPFPIRIDSWDTICFSIYFRQQWDIDKLSLLLICTHSILLTYYYGFQTWCCTLLKWRSPDSYHLMAIAERGLVKNAAELFLTHVLMDCHDNWKLCFKKHFNCVLGQVHLFLPLHFKHVNVFLQIFSQNKFGLMS